LAETKQIATLVLLTLLVGVSGLALVSYLPSLMEGDAVVDEYVATLYSNGTLVEDYTYNLKASNQYRMLFRVWDVPLSMGQLNRPYVQFLRGSSSEQLIVYAKDFQGSVWVEDRFKKDQSVLGLVGSLAGLNEVGVLKPDRFAAGRYTVQYVFLLHPPLEYDEDLCHLNLQLASQHLTYRNFRLIIEDADYSVATYCRPPPQREVRDGNEITFYGSAAKDELLELEILFKKDVLNLMKGFPRKIDNVKGLTVQANNQYLVQYHMAQLMRDASKALVVVNPAILLLIYVAFGREKRFVIPRYLSTVPNKERKPWIVNLVFKGDAFDFDENGFFATLLDLHMKGKIRIDTKNDGLTIKVLDQTGGDIYETRALKFLQDLSKDGIMDTDSIKEFAKNLTASELGVLLRLNAELNYLTRVAEPKVASEFMVSGRKRIVPVLLISGLLLVVSVVALFMLPNIASVLSVAAVVSVVAVIQSVIAIAFPSTLFGKWLGENYREKLEWDSFRNMLSDLALIRKYAPQDLSMWGEWLVYGTTLGVGDSVVKAMKELKIQLPEVSLAPRMPMLFLPIMLAGAPSGGGGIRGFGGGGGGGFGSGGGFGGGGAGTR
jgi:uncharacterized membrane protein